MSKKINTGMNDLESLYSRQIYAIGKESMSSLGSANILISGLTGLGIEIAKCLSLTGMGSITLHHPINMGYHNVQTNYMMDHHLHQNNNEFDVERFTENMVTSIKDLNSNVCVKKMSILTKEKLKKFNVVVFCDHNYYDSIHYNEFCRNNNIRFICCKSRGLIGSIISDYGDMTVNDLDGEPIASSEVMDIRDNCIRTTTPHKLYTGDLVKLVRTSDAITQSDEEYIPNKYLVKVVDSYSFYLTQLPMIALDTMTSEKISSYASRAPYHTIESYEQFNMGSIIIEQQKIPRKFKFTSLIDQLKKPDFVRIDTMDWNRPNLLHSITKALDMVDTHSYIDELDNRVNHTMTLVHLDQMTSGSELTDMDKQMIESIVRTSNGILPPVDSIIGSIVSQEVVKVICGKFTPNQQTLYYDCLDILPENYLELRKIHPNDYNMMNDRYDSQRIILGNLMMNRLFDGKVFIVGSGAIGCEHLKNLAMMGMRNQIVTDMDHIELSNLSRQFLFRKEDIGKPKSVTASLKIHQMNPDIKVYAQENRVSHLTSDIYDKKFYDSVDCVMNALDNVEARIFVDEQCVEYRKPLLESGTLGTKGNIQTILPYLTESYGSVRDPPEEQIPVCTLKLFPYHYNHVVQFARDLFEGYFNRIPLNYRKAYVRENLEKMTPTDLMQCYEDCQTVLIYGRNFKHCIDYAYIQWHYLFQDQIDQILLKYPENHLDDDGNRFWTGTKKKPHSLKFNSNDPQHMSMIVSFSNIWADCMGIPNKKRYIHTDISKYKKFIAKLDIPKPKQSKDHSTTDIDTNTIIRLIGEILKETKKREKLFSEVESIDFEKDDDTNHHIDMITAVSCLRASNYSIEQKDRMETKKIAGRIIPALATTTSLVSGLASIELYKIFTLYKNDPHNIKLLERFRTGSFNLALQMFGFAEPYEVRSTLINNKPYNIWTIDTIQSNTTLEDLIESYDQSILINQVNGIKEKVYMEIGFITRDQEILYQNGIHDMILLKKCIGDLVACDQILTINLEPIDGRDDFENRTDTMIRIMINRID